MYWDGICECLFHRIGKVHFGGTSTDKYSIELLLIQLQPCDVGIVPVINVIGIKSITIFVKVH